MYRAGKLAACRSDVVGSLYDRWVAGKLNASISGADVVLVDRDVGRREVEVLPAIDAFDVLERGADRGVE